MKTLVITKSFFCVAMSLLLFTLTIQAQTQVTTELIAQKLQSIITSKIAGYQIKGQALTIIFPNDDTYTLSAGYSTVSTVPVDTTKKWHWGSTTKALTGFIVLQLIEEGKLSLDDTMGSLFDTDTLPNVSSSITIRELLRHTSGLKEIWSETVTPTLWSAIWSDRDAVWQPYQLVPYMPSPFATKGTHEYTNTNTYLLSFVIENVTGKSLETNFQERIFTPLGMSNSYLSTGKVVDMSDLNGVWNGSENRSTWSHTSFLSSRSGNSALISTTADVAKFYRKYYQNQLLPIELMDSVRVPAINSRKDYGVIGGIRYYQTYGYHTELLEMVLSDGEKIHIQGHAGNGLGNAIAVHWDSENVTLVMVQNDFTQTTGFTQVQLFSELIKILISELPKLGENQETPLAVEKTTTKSIELLPTYPNPFQSVAQIGFSLPMQCQVKITVFDLTGRQISMLVDAQKTAGIHQVSWDAARQPSGMYVIRMEAEGRVVTQKITLK